MGLASIYFFIWSIKSSTITEAGSGAWNIPCTWIKFGLYSRFLSKVVIVQTSGVETWIRKFLTMMEPSLSSSSTLITVALAVHPVAFLALHRYQYVVPSLDQLFLVNLKALWVTRTPSFVLFPKQYNSQNGNGRQPQTFPNGRQRYSKLIWLD